MLCPNARPAPSSQIYSRRLPHTWEAVARTVKTRCNSGAKFASVVIPIRRASWFVVRVPSELKVGENLLLEKLLEQCDPAKTAYDLAQAFGTMVRERRPEELTDWISRAKASCVAVLKNFAIGWERDQDAVKAGLRLS